MRMRRVVTTAAGALGLTWVARALWGLPTAMGASISAIQPYATGSTSYRNRQFHNTEPSSQIAPGAAPSLLRSFLTQRHAGRPARPVPLVTPQLPAQAADLAVTWYGHATALIEVDGYRILTDPVWSERVSPSPLVGPARLHPVPAPLSELPPVDAVIISHDHYDHLDAATVRALVAGQSAPFVVPVGIGAHLRHWGVPDQRIVELDWGGSVSLSELGRARDGEDLTITCVEARHFSGRGLIRNTTLWASWSLAGPTRRVYFGGDTGYTKAFAEAGTTLGPFDLTLLPIGAYDERWTDVHMNPEEAVRAHADLCAGDPTHGLLVPIHWATFNLAFHGWSEPVQRMVTAARAAGTIVAVPKPGERLDPDDLPSGQLWWKDIG
ncbi:MBL fold metallo-hydrolase [Nocardia cyriacigeorgica]|uniref:MBL fold metallo-hydrolase n=1 Tax=Nocardia cyriacigeorgica TaxID=135487 RepID=UPI0018952138|nr:MBL fold metallo-hydrolase [Nocardia cyriacigeorgica]MBF6083795.1 MBL fold metallo-hydrolase [Nocardia cyriacigeorgica]